MTSKQRSRSFILVPIDLSYTTSYRLSIVTFALGRFGYQVILVSEVMNLPMRLQKQLSAQQSQLWSAQPLISFQSSACTIVKCGRLNGMDAVLINCTLSNLSLVTAASHISRRDAVILRRLRIGHTRVTHKYLLSGDSQPLCDKCQCSLTVEHILLECCSLKDVCENYFTCSSLKELFENVDATTIMDFIKEVNFYHLV